MIKMIKASFGIKKYFLDNDLVAMFIPPIHHATGKGYQIEKTKESFSNYKEMKKHLERI